MTRTDRFREPAPIKALSQATLVELALAGAVRGFTLHAHAEGYALSVQYGLSEGILTAKRGGPRRFARIETAFALLRDLRAAVVEVRLAPTPVAPRPYRRGRPAALAALDQLQSDTRA